MSHRGITISIHDASLELLPIEDWAETVLISPVRGQTRVANMAPPQATSTGQKGVGSNRERVSQTDHGSNPRTPPTQEINPQVIGVNETILFMSSEDEARGEMVQELVDPHAPLVELKDEFSEDEGVQRDDEYGDAYAEDDDGEGSEDPESESEAPLVLLKDASEYASDPTYEHVPENSQPLDIGQVSEQAVGRVPEQEADRAATHAKEQVDAAASRPERQRVEEKVDKGFRSQFWKES